MHTFLISRLRHASLPELCCRARQVARAARIRRAARRGRLPFPVPDTRPEAILSLALPAFEPAVDPLAVEAVLSGKRFAFAGAGLRPETADEEDIRAVWEPARLQHLTLIFARLSTLQQGEEADRLARFARAELLAWLDGNPFPTGPHYRSAMECGLRIPVFFYALRLLDNLDAREFARISAAVWTHALWTEANLSLYSSLGNHTVCEAVGLVFAGAVFRDSPRGRRWLARGTGLLDRELTRQVLEDGGALEQSLSYHRFVLDLYWLTADFLGKNALHDTSGWKTRLRLGEEFLAAFSDDRGGYPLIGDSDDGHALAPGLFPARELPDSPRQGCRTFPAAGYTVLNAGGDARITFDHGPLGMPPLNNHGHADALSITLSVAGEALLVDPGTYRYNGVPLWRRYFKGTAAHNTVAVDALDQAVQQTGFIWSSPYGCQLLQAKETPLGYLVDAEHDGYRRLKEPVLHRRALLLAASDVLVVSDSFSGTGEHEFALHFHLHPQAVVTREKQCWSVARGKSRIWIRLFGEADLELLHGGEDSPLGWYAPSYGVRVPAYVLGCRKRGACRSVSFRTVIGWGSETDFSWLKEAYHD